MESQGELRVRLEYHEHQFDVFNDACRYKVICCGRRWGKTRGAVQWLLERALENPETLSWWVSPTYRQAKIAYRYMRRLFYRSGVIKDENKSEQSFTLVNDAVIEFKSSDQPDNLRGEGVGALVLDEFGLMPREVWEEILRSSVMDTKAPVVFIGTPKGALSLFYELFQRGQEPNSKEWRSWTFPSHDNPFIDGSELEDAKLEMPELSYRQEILAEFLQNSGTVFRNIRECANGRYEEPEHGINDYVIGVDLGKYKDFTVLTVGRADKIVAVERFNQIDWSLQKARILELSKKYNYADIILDSTGLGDPIYEDLTKANRHIAVEGYQLSQASKRALIDNLAIALDQRRVSYPAHPQLIQELIAYTYEVTSSGNLRMNAPSGYHDDMVISLALAVWKMGSYLTPLSALGSGRVLEYGQANGNNRPDWM